MTQRGSPETEQLRALRGMIEQQAHEIQLLKQQVNQLKQEIESSRGHATPTPGSQNLAPPSDGPATGAATATPETGHSPTPPAAPPGGTTHVVARGETLISIAKHYKVSVADLLKVNKIEDERKLQIGQTINIPPNIKPSDSSPQ